MIEPEPPATLEHDFETAIISIIHEDTTGAICDTAFE